MTRNQANQDLGLNLSETHTHVFHFVLLDQFSHMSLNTAIETLQNANLVSGQEIYRWKICGETNDAVTSSVGMEVPVEMSITEIQNVQDIVIVSGGNVFELDLSKLKVWLARVARGNVRITGLGTGAIVMASLGLLNGVQAAVHNWYRSGFAEHFPELELSNKTHVYEGLRCSSAGGVSGIDLFLDFIALDHGIDFSNLVSESMCYTPLRLTQKSVDTAAVNSLTVLHPVVSKVVAVMEKTIDEPVSPSVLAKQVNISTRQLERLFQRYLGNSPSRHFMKLRLQSAYRLLLQSKLSVMDVSLATGFTSPSHFSRCFKAEYDMTPYALRHRQALD